MATPDAIALIAELLLSNGLVMIRYAAPRKVHSINTAKNTKKEIREDIRPIAREAIMNMILCFPPENDPSSVMTERIIKDAATAVTAAVFT